MEMLWCSLPLMIFRRFDLKVRVDAIVCATKESGDNTGLIELDDDLKEQILDAINDGMGADMWVDVVVIMP